MLSDSIRLLLTNFPLVLFVLALVVAALKKRTSHWADHYLAWFLLLPVGLECIWAGFFHVAFPQMAAAQIGWQVSPFQFEIGVADLAIGIVAVISFWRSLDFKAAVTGYIVLFYLGVAYGHIHQAISANNFSPDNFGSLLVMTILKIAILSSLLFVARRQSWQAATFRALGYAGISE